ncbi:MAG: FAD-binding protein [Elusimicrobium sp.]|jgi:glycolate oxidase subunit GlcD|nr:FAD-binding protein [Elusimicrobium sp.]
MLLKKNLAAALSKITKILGKEFVMTDEISVSLFSFDCSLGRTRPDAVLTLKNINQAAQVIKILHKYGVPFTARAAATNHVGGCVALKGGVVLNLMPLNKIIKIDTTREIADVECGVIHADLQARLDKLGYVYQPDPASQKICTLGGNAALNAGGAKGLKYGATREHIAALQFVTPQGEELILSEQDNGPDLRGLVIGSEGTLGVITKLRVKIAKKPKFIKTMLAAFDSVDAAINCVAKITAAGIAPRCVEAMDKLTICAVESYSKSGYPTDCEALLLIETDGDVKKAEKEMEEIKKICIQSNAVKTEIAKDDAARAALWRGRSAGYAAMARLAPNVFVEDGTVPRANLPAAIKQTREICEKYGVTSGLFFHAGDGNLHPNIVFDQRSAAQTNDVVKAGKEILKACAALGGTISGEHGIGIEKRAAMAFMYGPQELELFKKIKKVFDPLNIANPDKILPVSVNGGLRRQESAETQNSDKIFEIDTENYTVTFGADVTAAALKKELAARGLYAALPDYKGTAGELFASGICPKFNHSVTGITAALPDGNTVSYGGKFVKNSAGYNLVSLFAGAGADYGRVTKFTARIFKEPVKAALIEKTNPPPVYAAKIKEILHAEVLNGKL